MENKISNCKKCNKEISFYCNDGTIRQYCSRSCYTKSDAFLACHAKRRKTITPNHNCKGCNKSIVRLESEIKDGIRLYCTRDCYERFVNPVITNEENLQIEKSSHPKEVGDISNAMILAKLVKNKKKVLIPFGENNRYDLVIDEKGKFSRIQCKTGRYKGELGVILFPTYSLGGKKQALYYFGEIEYFAIYCPELEKVYMIGVDDAGKTGQFRVTPPKNNQKWGVKWAKDYEI